MGVLVTALLIVAQGQDRTPEQVAPVALSESSGPVLLADPAPQPRPQYDPYPKVGDRIGTITFETLGISWPIFEGTEEAELAQGVGHFLGSVLPGIQDNTILSGHQNTVFARLGELTKGDRILVETEAGVFVYAMTNFEVVDRADQTVIQPSKDATLTLTTCYPFGAIGNTTDAYIVTATLVSSNLKDQESK